MFLNIRYILSRPCPLGSAGGIHKGGKEISGMPDVMMVGMHKGRKEMSGMPEVMTVGIHKGGKEMSGTPREMDHM